MTAPKLRVRASGYNGSGYSLPTRPARPGSKKDFLVVPGVTTVLRVIDKPALIQWSVDQVAAYAVNNVDALLSRNYEQGFGFLRYFHSRKPKEGDPLRQAHRFVLNDAAELGTNTHDWIEAYLNGWDLPDLDYPEAEEMVEQFLLWESEHTVEPILTEATVVGDNYAGTLDLFALVDGVPTLLDIKTSRGLWREHRMQVAALAFADTWMEETHAFDEEGIEYTAKKETSYWKETPSPALSATQYGFLHLRPFDYDSQGEPMDAFCEMKLMKPESLEKYFQAFINALDLVYSFDDLKEEEKDWQL